MDRGHDDASRVVLGVVLGQVSEGQDDRLRHDRVQPAGRLVQEDVGRAAQELGRQGRPLPLAARDACVLGIWGFGVAGQGLEIRVGAGWGKASGPSTRAPSAMRVGQGRGLGVGAYGRGYVKEGSGQLCGDKMGLHRQVGQRSAYL